jgi:hypothetical protein
LEIPFEIKSDLFDADFGRTLNSHLHKRPSSEYILPLEEESLRKPSYSHIGHWEEFKDGMSSEPIEGESSHLEITPILSPSMPPINVSFKPILDLDDPMYALSLEPHDDPRNPLRQPKHRNHEGSKEDQEEQQQWLEDNKNSYVVASKEWLAEAKTVRVLAFLRGITKYGDGIYPYQRRQKCMLVFLSTVTKIWINLSNAAKEHQHDSS